MHALCTCIGLLIESKTGNNNSFSLVRNLEFIRSYYCQQHTLTTAAKNYAYILIITNKLIGYGFIKEDGELPSKPQTNMDHQKYKEEKIPDKTLNKLKAKLSADQIFDAILLKCCTPNIAKRLKEHVNSKKNSKHHRGPLVEILPQLHATSTNWHENPKIINNELSIFRDDLLNNYQRSSAYGRFQNVKNSFLVLIEHQLLPNNIVLPNNLRRCTRTQKVRSNNPLISNIKVYDEHQKEKLIDSSTFISDLKKDLSNNLNIIVSEAKNIVYDAYHAFQSKKEIVEKSQVKEFINHPKMLVKNNTKGKKYLNPFYNTNPLSFENQVAALDHYFDSVVQNVQTFSIYGFRCRHELLGYLGLLPKVASAMQIIIVEELGINPYSLYKVKIYSDSHGHEFVQVTDEGSVRLKALKPRARNARTRHAAGSTFPLTEIDPNDIDAATCLKMALEMTSRTRGITKQSELWLCLTKWGATSPTPETFQNCFNNIRQKLAKEKTVFNEASLKKIRTSKAILIYLDSNGNALKSATYLGNHVKTTLARYIPPYLSELVYRVKIRAFQNILLYMAVSSDAAPAQSLLLDSETFENQVKQAFKNPDMGGNLFERIAFHPQTVSKPSNIYFCVSEKNIALAIKYALEGSEETLREYCKNVLTKISEGPITMKQLLRKAHLAVQNG